MHSSKITPNPNRKQTAYGHSRAVCNRNKDVTGETIENQPRRKQTAYGHSRAVCIRYVKFEGKQSRIEQEEYQTAYGHSRAVCKSPMSQDGDSDIASLPRPAGVITRLTGRIMNRKREPQASFQINEHGENNNNRERQRSL